MRILSFYFTIHQNGKEKIAAICDEEIRNKILLHNGVKIRVKGEFYGQELFHDDEILIELTSCTSINAFGKRICNLLIEHKIVHPKSVLWISDNDNKIGHVIVVN